MAISSKLIFPTKDYLSSFFAHLIKEHDLHLSVLIENNKVFNNILAETGEDFIFRIRSNINEEELENNCGLPFRLRAKVTVKAIVDYFPKMSDKVEWEVPYLDPTDPKSVFSYRIRPRSDYELSMQNIETQIEAYDAIDFLYGKNAPSSGKIPLIPAHGKIPAPLTTAVKFRLIAVSKF